mgnify:CR=1 FL=1
MGDARAPLAIYKEVGLQCWDMFFEEWHDLNIEERRLTVKSREAAKDLRAIYINRKFLFAWQYCLDMRDQQVTNHWFLLQVIKQMFYKAEMKATMIKYQ